MRFMPACIFIAFALCGCNSVYYVPNSIEPNADIYAKPGGYSMKRTIKLAMQENGHKAVVGRFKKSGNGGLTETYEVSNNIRYYVRVNERKEILRPLWCMFNGFWWWNFEITIQDRQNSSEILSWRGRGCANSSVRKLNHILQEMESPTSNVKTTSRKYGFKTEDVSDSDDDFND